jgi:hypothetical protein
MAQAPVIERTDDACFPKLGAAYEAYNAKGKNGLIEYMYTDYLTGTQPGIYCYTLNGTDASESIVIGTWLGDPTGVPGQAAFTIPLSLGITNKTDIDFPITGWNYYYNNAEDLCCGPEKAWLYCAPGLLDGCGTLPTYSYTNQTNVGSIFSADGEKGDGRIFCACEIGEDTSAPFDVDEGVVKQVIAEATSGRDQLALVPVALVAILLFTILP